MKRLFLITTLILVFQISSFAQQESSFGVFMSSPVGKMKSTSLDDGGFAKRGWGIVFDSKYKINGLTEGFSLFLHSSYQWNKMDTEAIAAAFESKLNERTEVSDSKYSPFLITLGPSYEFLLTKNLYLGFNATGGVLMNNTKAFTIKVYDQANTIIFNELINFEDKVAFTYTFGTELKYDIVPKVFGLSLYADYNGASQKVEITSPSISSTSFEKLQFVNSGFKLIFYSQK